MKFHRYSCPICRNQELLQNMSSFVAIATVSKCQLFVCNFFQNQTTLYLTLESIFCRTEDIYGKISTQMVHFISKTREPETHDMQGIAHHRQGQELCEESTCK